MMDDEMDDCDDFSFLELASRAIENYNNMPQLMKNLEDLRDAIKEHGAEYVCEVARQMICDEKGKVDADHIL